jgi:hypothetical protein
MRPSRIGAIRIGRRRIRGIGRRSTPTVTHPRGESAGDWPVKRSDRLRRACSQFESDTGGSLVELEYWSNTGQIHTGQILSTRAGGWTVTWTVPGWAKARLLRRTPPPNGRTHCSNTGQTLGKHWSSTGPKHTRGSTSGPPPSLGERVNALSLAKFGCG